MTVEEARVALVSMATLDQRVGLTATRPSELGFSVGFGVGPTRDRVNAIEVWRPRSNADVVRFLGVDVFGLPAREVVRQFEGRVELAADEDGYAAREVYVALWRPFAADGNPEETQGYYFQSVLLARPGYDDTPAEAVARLAAGGHPGY